MRAEVARLERETLRSTGEGTPQALYERDVTVIHAANRRADLDAAADGLVFGRLDRRDGGVMHVGRLGVRTQAQEPLVVDWRAPAAAAFYRATPADPGDVVRRRLISCRGEQVLGVEDDLLDPDAADRLVGTTVVGDGAFLAAVSRERTGRMRDIVATIQREQDEAIRAPDDGALLVTGGPGTGKTAVALHRIAYLMYAHRERYARRGVLVVGPSGVFVDYISQVLPSLGETSVRLASLGGVPAGVDAQAQDPPAVAAVKGSARMAEVVRRAVRRAAERPLRDVSVVVEGRRVRVPAGQLSRRRAGLARSRRTHNGNRAAAAGALRELIWRAWSEDAGVAEWTEPQRARAHADVFDALRGDEDFEAALDLLWPVLQTRQVFDDLRAGRIRLAEVAGGALPDGDLRLLAGAWRGASALTVGDVALLDEIDALVGEPPEPEPDVDEDALPSDYQELSTWAMRTAAPRRSIADEEWHRDYAHVVVDEAQDVTPMQWRMLGRRGRGASWTIVGDWAQAAWADAASARAAMHDAVGGGRRVREHTLSTNYRTSTEIAALAAGLLRRIDPGAEPPAAVRSTGAEPVVVGGAADLQTATVEAVAGMLAEVTGTVGVAVPYRLAEAARRWLAGADGRVSVVDPWQAKGLEFDGCVVVAPEQVVAESSTGLRALYVAVTRATQRLRVVSADPDPVGTLFGG